MKKLLCFLIFVLFLGCSQSSNMFLGVGQALDSESPKISITSPENGIYVNKSDITITGNCSDNVGVTRIRAEAGINETAATAMSRRLLRTAERADSDVRLASITALFPYRERRMPTERMPTARTGRKRRCAEKLYHTTAANTIPAEIRRRISPSGRLPAGRRRNRSGNPYMAAMQIRSRITSRLYLQQNMDNNLP